jgi:hypothetical protein
MVVGGQNRQHHEHDHHDHHHHHQQQQQQQQQQYLWAAHDQYSSSDSRPHLTLSPLRFPERSASNYFADASDDYTDDINTEPSPLCPHGLAEDGGEAGVLPTPRSLLDDAGSKVSAPSIGDCRVFVVRNRLLVFA